MRENKYRAWDRINKRWLNLYSIIVALNDAIISVTDIDGEMYGMHQVELVEYTGLKDKNGKEIYEGDILQHGNKGGGYIGKAYWANETASFRYRITEYNTDLDHHLYMLVDRFEVIGNIYENPELICDG